MKFLKQACALLAMVGLTSCGSQESVSMDRLVNDGEVIVQQIERRSSSALPTARPELPEKDLKVSKPEQWDYRVNPEGGYQLQTQLSKQEQVRYYSMPQDGHLAGWHLVNEKGDFTYVKPPQSRTNATPSEGATIGNQKAIPTH